MARNGPRTLARRIEKGGQLPNLGTEHVRGCAIPAVPFRSGHLLAMRRFPQSSLGVGYTSIWHRDPDGRLVIYADQAPQYSCPRVFGPEVDETVTVPIELDWPEEDRLVMSIDSSHTQLHWDMRLKRTAGSRIADTVASVLPARLRRNKRVLSVASPLARSLFSTGKMRLEGEAPSGQQFRADMQHTWVIDDAQAQVNGLDLGEPGPLPEQSHLADFWLPQRGIFAIADGYFTPHDPERHQLVATRHELDTQP